MPKNGLAIFRTISGGAAVGISAAVYPSSGRHAAQRPALMPGSGGVEAHGRLGSAGGQRDIARLMSRLKSSEAQIWVLRRRNSVLAAAQEKRSCTIAAITCQSSWSKQATVLESFCARWQLGDLPELFLRVLQRQKLPDERECSLLSLTEREGHVFDRLRAAMYLERDWGGRGGR